MQRVEGKARPKTGRVTLVARNSQKSDKQRCAIAVRLCKHFNYSAL